jgi:2-oxo-4-hydroxy-4-carboxy--5-ureidoimidazoline (OHCU) decarboxylase
MTIVSPSAPAAVIRLELEAAPQVLADCLTEAECDRLLDWIHAHPELIDLLARTYELRDEIGGVAI